MHFRYTIVYIRVGLAARKSCISRLSLARDRWCVGRTDCKTRSDDSLWWSLDREWTLMNLSHNCISVVYGPIGQHYYKKAPSDLCQTWQDAKHSLAIPQFLLSLTFRGIALSAFRPSRARSTRKTPFCSGIYAVKFLQFLLLTKKDENKFVYRWCLTPCPARELMSDAPSDPLISLKRCTQSSLLLMAAICL